MRASSRTYDIFDHIPLSDAEYAAGKKDLDELRQRQADFKEEQQRQIREYQRTCQPPLVVHQPSSGEGWGMILLMLALMGGGAALCTMSLWLGLPVFMLGAGVLSALDGR